jgi:hypothetical protein
MAADLFTRICKTLKLGIFVAYEEQIFKCPPLNSFSPLFTTKAKNLKLISVLHVIGNLYSPITNEARQN